MSTRFEPEVRSLCVNPLALKLKCAHPGFCNVKDRRSTELPKLNNQAMSYLSERLRFLISRQSRYEGIAATNFWGTPPVKMDPTLHQSKGENKTVRRTELRINHHAVAMDFCACHDPYFEASFVVVQVLQEGVFLTWKPTAPATATADANHDTIGPEETLSAAPTTIIANVAENNPEED